MLPVPTVPMAVARPSVTAGPVPVTVTFAVTVAVPGPSVTVTGPSILAGALTLARPSILAGAFTLAWLTALARTVAVPGAFTLAWLTALARTVALAGLTILAVVAPPAGAVGLLRTVRAVLARRIVGLPVGWSVRPMSRSVTAVRPLLTRPFASSLAASLRGTP
jgi:hypothetical protein